MTVIPKKAFILAAGKGTRLRPVTDTLPKPMVRVGGRAIIDRTLDMLAAIGVESAIVNLHHHGEILREHLQKRRSPEIVFSAETELLETGGGVKKALPLLGHEPFFLINGDALWTDGAGEDTALERLAGLYDPPEMDMLLLMHDINRMVFGKRSGDYDLVHGGRAVRRPGKQGAYMFTGIRIVHPRALENSPEGPFSFLQVMDRSEGKGRLYGLPHTGQWYHISAPDDLERADRLFAGEQAET